MVSFQAPLSPLPEITTCPSSKKRKFLDDDHHHDHKPDFTKSFFEIELHLETPLPLEWQRCLDIQSGQIHFYNTRTHKRTSRDPRRSPEPSSGHMSLELELNLSSGDQTERQINDKQANSATNFGAFFEDNSMSRDYSNKKKMSNNGLGLRRSPSWLSVEEEDQQQEMMATVCTRCHMLVMLCKSSPACPNCKFIHPPDQSPPKLFKPRLSLLC